ncbi:MAG TPA: hypothetical protein DER02_14770 [Gammaproteobacteria bacterium]|nr:hypothetical protein [Gammaproteobacteria bacterium]|tara:strand:+ start:5172 stop:5549 length:378 start_codon:yes stop_codon:yes gene_type:complete
MWQTVTHISTASLSMPIWRVLLVMVLICSVFGTVRAAEVRPEPARGLVNPKGFAQQNGVTLRQAIRLAQRDTGGEVLSAESIGEYGSSRSMQGLRGQTTHRVRLLLDGGRVVTVVIDGQGRVIRR